MSRKPPCDNSWIDESIGEFVEVLEIIGEGPLKWMAPPEIWQRLDRGERNSAGHYISKLAKRPDCPIVFSHRDDRNHRLYRLRNIPARGDAVDID